MGGSFIESKGVESVDVLCCGEFQFKSGFLEHFPEMVPIRDKPFSG